MTAPWVAPVRRLARSMDRDALASAINQEEANATGQPVGGRRPQFYGHRGREREAAQRAKVYRAELRRRGRAEEEA